MILFRLAFCLLPFAFCLPGEAAPERPAPILSLPAAQARALAQNPGWQATLEELRAAEARVEQAAAGGKTQLTGRSMLYYTSRVPTFDLPPLGPPVGGVPGRTFELGPRENAQIEMVAERILWGGPTRPTIEQTHRALHAARLRSERARQELLYQVAEAYLRAAVAAERMTVAQENLRARAAHRQVAEARYETGLVPRYDIVRAETEVAAAEEQVTRVSNEYDLTTGRFALVIGDPLDRSYRLALPLLDESPLPPLETLLERAAAQRPDLAALEEERRAADALARAARSERRPALSLRAETRATAKDQPLDPSGMRGALVGTWPLGDGGRSRAREEEAEAQARALDLQREQLQRTVAIEVRSAALSIQNVRKRLETVERQVTQATSALEIAQARYDLGTGLSMEVAESEAARSEAQLSRLEARLDDLLAAARLRLALGEPAPAAVHEGALRASEAHTDISPSQQAPE